MQKWFLQTTTGLKSEEYTDYDKAVADADEKAYLGYYVADECITSFAMRTCSNGFLPELA